MDLRAFSPENPLTCTLLRIIQKNNGKTFEIVPLTDENGEIIQRESNGNYANKRALIIFESEFYNKFNFKKDNLNVFISNRVLTDFAKRSFNKYLVDVVNKKRFIVIKNNKGEKKVIEVIGRYNKQYQKKVKSRINWLIYKYGNKYAVSLTLTLDPKLFSQDKHKMWKKIKPELNRFITNMKYWFKKQKRTFPPYLCAIESQKNGNPHIHMVFFNAKRLLDFNQIRELWNCGAIYINRTYEGKKVRYPVNYVCKYIIKTYTDTNTENLLSQSLCWLFSVRSFSTSNGLIVPLNPKGLGEWKPICLIICDKDFDLSDLPDLFNEEFDFDGG